MPSISSAMIVILLVRFHKYSATCVLRCHWCDILLYSFDVLCHVYALHDINEMLPGVNDILTVHNSVYIFLKERFELIGVISDSEQGGCHGSSTRAYDPLYPPRYSRLLKNLGNV